MSLATIRGILTANSCRLLEDLGYLWIHLDHEIPLVSNFLVPSLYLLSDPFVECLSKNRRSNIADPLLWCLGQLDLWLRVVCIYRPMILLDEG